MTKEWAAIRSRVMRRLEENLPSYIDRMEELSRHEDQRTAFQATQYLIDRRMGKPTERVEDSRPAQRTIWIGPFAGGTAVAVVDGPVLPGMDASHEASDGGEGK